MIISLISFLFLISLCSPLDVTLHLSRRAVVGAAVVSGASLFNAPSPAFAEEPKITDKFSLLLKGGEDGVDGGTIVIGLYGDDDTKNVGVLKLLLGPGFPSTCKDKEVRTLQREQLEANKVYNSCMGGVDEPVSLVDSQVWRIVEDERIDFGSVVGKFVARTPPTFFPFSSTIHPSSVAGNVSVRVGSDGGFTFTITPKASATPTSLDSTNVVVGRVISGLDVVANMNHSGVVKSSKLSYKGLSGTKGNAAPSRSCRYGGDMFCSENKPLRKLTLVNIKTL